jgi:hypothetical protein
MPWHGNPKQKKTQHLITTKNKQTKKGYPQELPTKLADKACILVTFCLKISRRLLLLQTSGAIYGTTSSKSGSRFPSILMQHIRKMIFITRAMPHLGYMQKHYPLSFKSTEWHSLPI